MEIIRVTLVLKEESQVASTFNLQGLSSRITSYLRNEVWGGVGRCHSSSHLKSLYFTLLSVW